MGDVLFGIDISGLVAAHIGPGVLAVTIERDQRGARDPNNLTGGKAKGGVSRWSCRGFFENYTGISPPGLQVEVGDCKAVLIGDTIPASAMPIRVADRITIAGRAVVVKALQARDPAGATYVYQCHDVAGPDGA